MPITIYITGPVGSGKTTIAPLVHKALRDAGLEVIDETEPPEAWHVDGRTLDAVRSAPVTLREAATVRPAGGSPRAVVLSVFKAAARKYDVRLVLPEAPPFADPDRPRDGLEFIDYIYALKPKDTTP